MVTLFITASALAIVFIIGIGFFLWRRSVPETDDNRLPPVIDARSLFSDPAKDQAAEKERLIEIADEHARELISRAQNGEREALAGAKETGDAALYDRVLTAL